MTALQQHTLYVCATPDEYSVHRSKGRRAVLADEVMNGSSIDARRVVLASGCSAKACTELRQHFGDETVVLRECDLRRVNLRPLADVEPEPVRWLWPGYIASGKLTILAGDPGGGKSWVMLDVAARLSRGDAMPDGTGGGSLVGTLFISYDDGVGDTLRVRCLGLGADSRRIVCVDGNYDGVGDSRHIPPEAIQSVLLAAEDQERAMGCRIGLVVLDPLSAVLGGVDQNQSNSIYEKLGPLVTHCEAAGKALVCIDHTGKGRPDKAINLAIGSQGKAGLARLMALVADSGNDDGSRLFLSSKNSLGEPADGMRFQVTDVPTGDAVRDPGDAARLRETLGRDTLGTVRWDGTLPMTAQQWLDEQNQDGSGNSKGLGAKGVEALAFVLELIGNGTRLSAEIEAAARTADISYRTMLDAGTAVGLTRQKSSFGWFWRLPGEHPDDVIAEIRHHPSTSCALRIDDENPT
ncbi:MAG: AAA family ATPase [Planctomycetota bacterium]